ncbi:hypothetical protein [Tetragenococcus halophilus]|uniref:hypothetical protein n=1 Tax=Tetragenococcus halophilus TaxID=51669 RepID=UPI0024037A8B|nr:hypothetical protein [Tetragenococcus halophilus]GLL52306.1 hypothetical protein YA5_022850 [Tetragenococcus halophilus]
MKKEDKYILDTLGTNRGRLVAETAIDVNRDDSKGIPQIIQDAPENLDRNYIEERFNKLIDQGYLLLIDNEGHYMIYGDSGISAIKSILEE